MLDNLRRKNRSGDANAPLKPALYDPPGRLAQPAPGNVTPAPFPTALRENLLADGAPQGEMPNVTATAVPAPKPQSAGGKLSIGVNIKVKGVEISDCDVMVIEGHVEATVHSQVMEIAEPGTLMGTAVIDVAEIHGDFSGELTARTRLVVHGTGRVSGIIRYGKLVVAEGGELNGDVKQLDAADTPTLPTRDAAPGAPIALGTSDGAGATLKR
jgi:cytoskeletal protein CcmA (bactofilin family)